MRRVTSADGTAVSYVQSGDGPPLVLVHGSFSDHHTNWEFVKPALQQGFTTYAIARRGRGETDVTEGHGVPDEARDVVAVIQRAGEPVFLVGHSYGAHCALAAAALVPDRVRKLVLYEAPWPAILPDDALARLEGLAAAGAWDQFAATFFHESLFVPMEEIEALRRTELWHPVLADAPASLRDVQGLNRYAFDPERYRALQVPVLLQAGSESPRHLYVTDALAGVLPNARIEELAGQAHEGMTTAPQMYVEAVTRFLLS